ncbi:MAG: hypothetical protein GF372_05420 [Candidatus Marinimicrobia bacterium]|nr:hypothetical protein [Candidatus Neomarinimicrobiota bacterium]
MNVSILQKGAVVMAGLFLAVSVHAGHPLITEDSGTEGSGASLLELTSEYSRIQNRSFSSSVLGVCATVTTGVTENLDVLLDLPFESCTEFFHNTHSSSTGLETPVLGAKWRFLEASPRLSFAVKSLISLPHFGQNITENSFYEMYLISSYAGNGFGIHTNAGYARAPGINEEIWHASAAGEFAVGERITAVTNVSLDTPGSDNFITTLVGGVIYSVTDYFALDFGVQTAIWDNQKDVTFLTGSAISF